jgi:predicted protein tyrosine phosphatase
MNDTAPPPKPITDPQAELNKPQIGEVSFTTALQTGEPEPSLWKQITHLLQQIYKQGLWVTLQESLEQISRRVFGAPTVRYTRIMPNLLIGGQYTRAGWKTLQQRGVTAVVNMRGEYDERAHGYGPDAHLYYHAPTIDNHAPLMQHLRDGVTFIDAQIKAGGTVYVHCWEGVGRAATMGAAYLVSTGMKPSEAWAKIRQVRPFIRPTLVQIKQVDELAAEYGNTDTPPLSALLPSRTVHLSDLLRLNLDAIRANAQKPKP